MKELTLEDVVDFARWAQREYPQPKTYIMDPYAYRMLKWAADSDNARRRHPSKRERREMRTASAIDRRAFRAYRVREAPLPSLLTGGR